MTFHPDPKITTPRSDDFRALVECFGCCVCNQPAEAHHEFGVRRGTSSKASDFGCVPLCRKHHTERHTMPLAKFEDKHFVSLREVNQNLLHYRLTGQPLTMHLTVVKDFEEYLVVGV